MTDMIQVNHEDMAQYAVIKSNASQIDQLLDNIRRGLQKLHWDGEDRIAYDAAQKKWDDAVQDMNNVLMQIGNLLGQVGQNYITTAQDTTKLWS